MGDRLTNFVKTLSSTRGGREKLANKSILIRFETLREIESTLEMLLSPPAASLIIYQLARKCGISCCERIMEKTKRKEEVLIRLSELKDEENWGKILFQDMALKKGSGRVLIADSFEAVVHKTTQPSCQFFRGFLSGFLSKLLEKPIAVVEEKCKAKGDEHCEFIFTTSLIFTPNTRKDLWKV